MDSLGVGVGEPVDVDVFLNHAITRFGNVYRYGHTRPEARGKSDLARLSGEPSAGGGGGPVYRADFMILLSGHVNPGANASQ